MSNRIFKPVFIGGAPRSGLTLLRVILDAHPNVTCPPDAGFLVSMALQWRDIDATMGGHLHEAYGLTDVELREAFRQAIEKLVAPSLAEQGESRLIMKSEMNAVVFDVLGRLFPESRMLLITRDGRDVVTSLLERDWRDSATGERFPYTRHAAAAANYWVRLMQMAFEARSRLEDPDRVLAVSYEELVETPVDTLKAICSHIDVEWSDALLDFHRHPATLVGTEAESRDALRRPLSPRSVGRWERDLTEEQVASVRPVLNGFLDRFGFLARKPW